MDTIGQLFTNPLFVWCLVITMTAIATTSGLFFHRTMVRSIACLRSANLKLAGIANAAALAAAWSATRAAIRSRLQDDDDLVAAWDAYQEGAEELPACVLPSSPASGHFQLSSLLRKEAVIVYAGIPGTMVGLGLVFTFLGIAVVIHQASSSLELANNTTALGTLLGAASTKFWTSLIGVLLSLVSSWHYRMKLHEFSGQNAAFVRRLMVLMPPRRDHETAEEELLNELKGARGDFQALATKSMEKLSQSLAKAMQEALADGLKSLPAAVEGFSNQVKILESHALTLGNQLQAAADAAATAGTAFKTMLGDIGTKTKDDCLAASGAMKQAREQMDAIAKQATKAAKPFEHLGETAEKFDRALARVPQLEVASQALRGTAESLASSGASVADMCRQHIGHMERLDGELAGVVTALPGLFNQYANALSTYTSSLEANLEFILERFSQVVGTLGEHHEAHPVPRGDDRAGLG